MDKEYISARLREPSTWRGLVYMVTSIGISISPQGSEAIISVGLFIAGFIGTTSKD